MKHRILKKIIELLKEYAIPSLTPCDFEKLEEITNKLLKHYKQ